MKKKVVGITMAVMLMFTILMGTVQVFAGSSPYQEIQFVDMDDYEQDKGNEYHSDVLKLEGNLGGTFDGAWMEYDGFSFGTVGAVSLKVNYCNNSGRCAEDARMEVWIDAISPDKGTKVGTVNLPATGGSWENYEDTEAKLDIVITGDHDIFFVLAGSTSQSNPFISNLMSFEFVKGEGEEEPTEAPAETEQPTEEPTPTPTEKPTQIATTAPAASTASAAATQNGTAETTNGDSTMVIVIVVVVVVVAAAAVAAYVLLKKKKA